MKTNRLVIRVLALLMVALPWMLVGCGRSTLEDAGPRERLEQYVSRSFAVKSPEDREMLLEHLTGEAKIRLASWSPEQFKSAFMDSKRTFVKLGVVEERKVDDTHVDITYEIAFLDGSRAGGPGAKVTQRKVCRLQQEAGRWMITEVRSLKELVEYQGEMTFP